MMLEFKKPEEEIDKIVNWGRGQEAVRGEILTSTFATPGGPVDLLSDYDVILILRDIQPYFASRDWLGDFGPVLAIYRDPWIIEDGYPRSAYVVQYENGLKIDFSLWQVEHLQQIAALPELPEELDAGYRVLLDKDGLTEGLKAPTYRGYIPKPPSEAEYLDRIEQFFLNACYVAKFLWRDDVMAAMYILNSGMRHEDILPMLEWHGEIEHDWTVKPGPYGRRLKKWLRSDLWKDLETTYTGAGIEENWEALERTIELMRKAAHEVGERLGYAYPEDLERRARGYLGEVRRLAREEGSRQPSRRSPPPKKSQKSVQ